MTARSRHLAGAANARPPATTPSTTSPSPPVESLDSDFVVILAALICALICVLGLLVVARCSWIRRIYVRRRSTPDQSTAAPRRSAANKGLKKKAMKTLPKLIFGEERTGKLSDCAICLAEFAAGEEVRVLPQCGHGFHVSCIDTWLGLHSSCPSCRQILVVARCQKCGSLPAVAVAEAELS